MPRKPKTYPWSSKFEEDGIDHEIFKLKLALLKENFAYWKFYKELKKDPCSKIPELLRDNEDGNIYTSAKVDSGNSGGLAVDDLGCMVGIPTAVSSGEYENLGYLISTDNINKFLTEFTERNQIDNFFTNLEFK